MRVIVSRIAVTVAAMITCAACSSSSTGPSGNNWVLELVASGNEVGLHSSLTTTSDGTVHLAYHDSYDLKLFHARRIGPGSWEHTQLDTIGWIGKGVNICTDPGDTLHMVYQDIYVKDLRYARNDGQSWVSERIDLFTSEGISPMVRLSTDGIHIVEFSQERSQINYWTGSLNNWVLSSSIYLISGKSSFGFAIGPEGPAIAAIAKVSSWRSSLFNLLFLKADTPTGPFRSTVVESDLGSNDISYLSLCLEWDSAGTRHLLYRFSGGRLVDSATGTIDSNVGNGIVRIQKSTSGELWILYPLGSGLAVARFTAGSGWSRIARIQHLNPEGRWGLHVDNDGVVHVSVYSASRKELWYGRWESSP